MCGYLLEHTHRKLVPQWEKRPRSHENLEWLLKKWRRADDALRGVAAVATEVVPLPTTAAITSFSSPPLLLPQP